MSTTSAERMALRYPPTRTPKWLVIVVVAVIAVVALSWLVTVALRFANPAVSAEITTFDVVSEQETTFTMAVHRRDPAVEVSCEVFAEALNHERVGELLDLRVPGSEHKSVTVNATLETFRSAASVTVVGCHVVA